jgi:hypothetical protein
MKNILSNRANQKSGSSMGLALALVAAVLSSGCHVIPKMPNAVQDMGPRYHPSNIYRRTNSLPAEIRRVALLPVMTPGTSTFLQAGVETLSPIVYSEVEKTRRFEVIPVSPQQLKQWTGKIGWRTDEVLPPNFFAAVSENTGCDAILFCQLTRFQPYQPMAIGWKFSLVANPPSGPLSMQVVKAKIIWAVDEVVDAGEPSVSNGARDYYGQHIRSEEPSADASIILNSPSRFGQYTLATLLDTLPGRPLAAR